MLEVLSPAGSTDALVAAVQNGADAVYLGYGSFNARMNAKNFTLEQLRQAVSYCHIRGVKVYLTLNTIIFDNELEDVKRLIIAAARADVDALIVQNMGTAMLAKRIAPELPLHASTQMSVHSPSGAKLLWELGFKRVVLARELSRAEIKEIAESCPIELEVFVHGALCMCVSGQCYFSAVIGSRSGNRGRCAQTCRLPFSVGGKSGYALSLKDNSLIPYLNELEAIGVASAKIEGRMKRPEYVAAAVRACVEQRDLGFVTDPTAARLRGVFSRTGFTDGYYTDRRGKGMFGTRTRGDVAAADEKLLAQIRQTYKDEAQHIPLSGSFAVRAGEKGVLRLTDGTHTVEAFTDCAAEPARSVPLSPEKCRAQLAKTGGTAYRIDNLSAAVEDGVSLPLSALNTVRRAALAALDARRAQVHHYEINEIPIHKPQPYRPDGQVLRARVPKTKLGEGFRGCERVFVPLFSDTREWERLLREGYSIGVEVPRGMFGREEQIERQLSRARAAGVSHALCHNIGALWTAKRQGFVLHGGFGLNLCNTYDLLWAEEYGIADVELSWELTFERINRLGGSIGRGIVSYGYLPLMLCRSCPVQGAGMDCKSCKNRSKMTDRKGKRFLLRCDGTCTEVLNCVPLYIAEEEISKLSTSFHILRFTVENSVENVERVGTINDFSMLKDNFTRGLYKRGVE